MTEHTGMGDDHLTGKKADYRAALLATCADIADAIDSGRGNEKFIAFGAIPARLKLSQLNLVFHAPSFGGFGSARTTNTFLKNRSLNELLS